MSAYLSRTVIMRRPVVYPGPQLPRPFMHKLLIFSHRDPDIRRLVRLLEAGNSPVPFCVSCSLSTTHGLDIQRLVRLLQARSSRSEPHMDPDAHRS
jgi:hypothetical protein